ncbi:hypothetical protein HO173_010782 [Letharia columbiana]|uniref:Uncharacterized protein n=1 Tax=Letharia columbiana TaxID=112416 RepID=A0A8H6FM54_9LECA|nr:uncharacterized protein HO173_010782 [Letharia columbiana]KAF6231082.1 hypothetical protein HO173_010782 [Letharia columbiana]
MSEPLRDLSETSEIPQPLYGRGQIVFIETNLYFRGKPTRKMYWIWESMYDPLYGCISYSLRDGPGEGAKVMGWASEEDLELDLEQDLEEDLEEDLGEDFEDDLEESLGQ